MIRSWLLIGALVSAPVLANKVEWFEKNTPLTQAHHHLLNDDLPSMFNSLVEVWQQEEPRVNAEHLNDLLLQSFELDCGKGLDTKNLPNWLSKVVIRRTDIQSPGRDAFRIVLEATSDEEISDLTLKRWVDRPISADETKSIQAIEGTDKSLFTKRYNVNSRVPKGLYRLDVTTKNQESWSSWVLLGDPKARQTVRWSSKDQWVIEKNALLNSFCTLPKLEIGLYDYVDGKYQRIWSEVYESDYPTSLDMAQLDPGRYVLAISMTHQRWQGAIIVEQSQIISKTYDVSVEE